MSKAGRPKKDSAGLPEWFDVEKYRRAKSYGAAEWLQQLAFRSLAHKKLSIKASYSNEWLSLLQSDPHITIERLEASAIGQEEEDPLIRSWYIDTIVDEISLPPQHSHYGVKPITNGDITKAYRLYMQKREAFLDRKKAVRGNVEAEKIFYKRIREIYTESPFENNQYKKFVQVDLALPDSVLKNSFADYLRSQRKFVDEPVSPFFKNQDFTFWYNSGALPYLDLHLWEAESGRSFRWAAFVDALSTTTDKPVGSEDSCRKTAKTLATKLMDEWTIHTLRFQAIKEQSQGGKKSGKLFVR